MSRDLPGGSVVKNPLASAGDPASILGSGRFPGEGNGSPFQYLCQGNPMDRGPWWATVSVVAKESDVTGIEQQSPCHTPQPLFFLPRASGGVHQPHLRVLQSHE